MNKIPFQDSPNTTTPVNADNLNLMQDNAESAINKKIDFVKLLTVDDTAPDNCVEGDLYYNTLNELIYPATGTDTWSTVGTSPNEDCLYIDITHHAIYYYDGTSFNSYGAEVTNDLINSTINPPSVDALNSAISDINESIGQVTSDLSQLNDDCGFVDSNITTTGSLAADWKVRKWNNGFCEMWGSATWTVNVSQTYGYCIYSAIDGVPLPITLDTICKVQINTFATSQIYYTTAKNYTKSSFSFFVAKPDTAQPGSQSIGFEFYVRGNWK